MEDDSIFTKIINNEIPAHKIYEDEFVIAFLDIHPIQPGHTLVVPKVQVDQFDDLDEDYYLAVWKAVKKVAKAQKKVFHQARIGVQIFGLDVPHAHIHVFPFTTAGQYRNLPDFSVDPNQDELAQVATKLREAL